METETAHTAWVRWGRLPVMTFYAARKGTVKGLLSNFYVNPVTFDRVEYASGEHALHAAKAGLMGDEEMRARIEASTSPAEAKRLGRMVRGYVEEEWADLRFKAQCTICMDKLERHPELIERFVNYYLVEASPKDRLWGVGLSSKEAAKPELWGDSENLLGRAWTHCITFPVV